MTAWRQAGTSTVPSSLVGGLSSGWDSSQKPRAAACSRLTRYTRVTADKACDKATGLRGSSGTICHWSSRGRSSLSDKPRSLTSAAREAGQTTAGQAMAESGIAEAAWRPSAEAMLVREASAFSATPAFEAWLGELLAP